MPTRRQLTDTWNRLGRYVEQLWTERAQLRRELAALREDLAATIVVVNPAPDKTAPPKPPE